jgi:hypothetical protein
MLPRSNPALQLQAQFLNPQQYPNPKKPSIIMPNILTIPREIRDEIYKWGLLDTLASAKSRALQHDRKRVAYAASDPETHYGEDSVRYPQHTSLPATYPLLHTSRQLRAELLERVKSMGPLRYRIDLTNRDDKNALYPTWISVPVLPGFQRGRVDVLECVLRMRSRKTSSVWTVAGDEESDFEGDAFYGGLSLLQRFVERGVYFLSKKKAEKISVGLLAIDVDKLSEYLTEEECIKEVDDFADRLDEWMRGVNEFGSAGDDWEREDGQFRFLAGKIDKLSLSVKGSLRREWDLREMVTKRDEEERLRAAQVDVEH